MAQQHIEAMLLNADSLACLFRTDDCAELHVPMFCHVCFIPAREVDSNWDLMSHPKCAAHCPPPSAFPRHHVNIMSSHPTSLFHNVRQHARSLLHSHLMVRHVRSLPLPFVLPPLASKFPTALPFTPYRIPCLAHEHCSRFLAQPPIHCNVVCSIFHSMHEPLPSHVLFLGGRPPRRFHFIPYQDLFLSITNFLSMSPSSH